MKVTLKNLQKYIEARKKELDINVDGDEYRNKGDRTPEKVELLKRIGERNDTRN